MGKSAKTASRARPRHISRLAIEQSGRPFATPLSAMRNIVQSAVPAPQYGQSASTGATTRRGRMTLPRPAPRWPIPAGSAGRRRHGAFGHWQGRMAIAFAGAGLGDVLARRRRSSRFCLKRSAYRRIIIWHPDPAVALAQAKLGRFAEAEAADRAHAGRLLSLPARRAPRSPSCRASMRPRRLLVRPRGAQAALPFPSPMPNGARRCWRAASRTRPSRNSRSPTRKARTSPIRWKAGARR